ncbi:hypothetical protein QN277_022420 [Acacia crassicarpa]|uniref:LOB domain-containing protein n=1 Tax=Acacia crassicarpa TaxID=499986 RepID=A0AAE1JJM2_9FABA|nr:hypothetical protein QN277_022420 [Acacia crassicarpa]
MNISQRNTTHNHDIINNNNNQACAACKYQRKKCAPDCILAPYFPHDRQRQFLNAHKLFGVKKIIKSIKHLDPHSKDETMGSIIIQSDMRANDPVGGCYRYIQNLESQVRYYEAEHKHVLQKLAFLRSQVHYHHHHPDHLNHVHNKNPITPATTHYQYLQFQHQQQLPCQQQEQQQQEPLPYMVHQMEHQSSNVVHQMEHQSSNVSLQDDVSASWASVQDSMSWPSLSLQNNKNGGGVGDGISGGVYISDELCNDQKSSSMPLLNLHCDDERNEIGFETQQLVDRSDEGVLFKTENAVTKAEADDDCIQQDQDHDLKGAATLFTLTNCTT